MDNSQSSDVFSENDGFSCESPTETMAEDTYETLVQDTKLILSRNLKLEAQELSFTSYILSALNNCKTCVFQSLDHVTCLLSEAELTVTQLCSYLEDAVTILRLLCTFITSSAVELVSMNCVKMKTFPTCTGNIILTVFSHCKDSESTYGPHLKSVEKQLKDLFRSCHELQLAYLMVLEKHFIFDLSEDEELDVLVEALEINLRIGEIVQTLDVKTMAEQWKAYTMICEKYSDPLKDRQIYENCTKVLCHMIQNNIGVAVESNKEEKMMIRPLKVASFTIKILLRVCNIFKLSSDKNYNRILDLLLYIYQYNPSYLQCSKDKSIQCLNSVNSLIFVPTEILVKDLLQDDKFVNDMSKLQTESFKDEKLLSYILLVISVTKYYTAQENVPHNCKEIVLECIFKWLPYGHIWFNLGLKFKSEDTSVGLYEHLLTHTFALTCTLTSNEISFLEKKMYESIFGMDCYCAMFTSNLWELLAKLSSRPYVYSQLLSLCETYQRLESHKMFVKSPQKVHLSHLIGNLFQTLHIDDKMKLYKLFDPVKETNFGLWAVLRVESLGCENTWHINEQVETSLRENLKDMLYLLLNSTIRPEDFEHLINLIKLTATGLNVEPDLTLQDYVTQAWIQLCPKYNRIPLNSLMNQDSIWYLEYIEELATLTQALRYIFLQNDCKVKVLHVILGMIDNGPTELKLIVINLLFNTCRYVEEENGNLVQELHVKIFKTLLADSDNIVKSKICNEIRKQRNNQDLGKIFSELHQDDSFRNSLKIITEYGCPKTTNVKHQLTSTFHLNYIHKCLEKCVESEPIVLSDSGTIVKSNSNASNNFNFLDMDTLFETESDSEPASKRVKLDCNEADEIIKRLEQETSLLCNVKDNVISSECKIRIRDVCERLLNIID